LGESLSIDKSVIHVIHPLELLLSLNTLLPKMLYSGRVGFCSGVWPTSFDFTFCVHDFLELSELESGSLA
jgi:hypothetical protein